MRSQLFSYTYVPPGSFHRHTGLDRLYKEKSTGGNHDSSFHHPIRKKPLLAVDISIWF